jgi:hypothetical protein
MGGGSPSNTTSTSTTQLSPQMQAMVNQNYSAAQGVAGQPYNPYSGQVVAPTTVDQRTAGGIFYNNAQIGGYGQGTLDSGIGAANTAGSYQPQQVGTGTWNPAAAAQYTNPYTQSVINTTNAQIDRNLGQTQVATNANATQAGAYGGTRQAVANTMNTLNANQVKASTDAQLNDQAYNNAQTQFNADQARQLTAGTANQSAGLQAANLGLGSAQVLGGLGAMQNNLYTGAANGLGQWGTLEQNTQNQQNQWNYQNNYLNPQQWPMRGLNALESAVSGIPSGSSTANTTPVYSNQWGSALGGAATGAAIGSVIPGVGTAVGAGVGGLLGYFGA